MKIIGLERYFSFTERLLRLFWAVVVILLCYKKCGNVSYSGFREVTQVLFFHVIISLYYLLLGTSHGFSIAHIFCPAALVKYLTSKTISLTESFFTILLHMMSCCSVVYAAAADALTGNQAQPSPHIWYRYTPDMLFI